MRTSSSQTSRPICYMHPLFGLHDPGPGHPERPERYAAVEAAVAASGLPVTTATAAPEEALQRVHDPRLLAGLRRLSAMGGGCIDPDTAVNEVSFDAAAHASGAAIAATEAVLRGEIRDALCAGRPPGHHAERARPMGFCIINHAAVAAAHARALGAERVAVLDWDAHHGNGTEEIFAADPSVLYVSLHQWPHYPGTGAAGDRGVGPGEGATLNLPLPAGTGDEEYLEVFSSRALPAVVQHRPDLIIVSAGFDAHADDPLCSLRLTEGAFARMAEAVGELDAGRVYVLEGGYDLDALRASVEAVLGALDG
jgi:acetoin utilization deacetylase AcuC-like enzyme